MILGVLKTLAIAALGIALALVSGLATTKDVKDHAAQVWKVLH